MSVWASLFVMPILALAWLAALVLVGAPLLWAFVRSRPIRWQTWLHGASEFIITGCVFSLGMIIQEAYVRELISGTTGEIAVAVILLIAWASTAFLSRRSR